MSSDSRYSYDESADVWPYFVGTLVGAVIVPVTAAQVAALIRRRKAEKKRLQELAQSPVASEAKLYNESAIAKFRSARARSELFSASTFFLICGWLVVLACAVVVFTAQPANNPEAVYDPWEILGVTARATASEIKSAYRKLSLKFHPDKAHALREELSAQEIESRFIDMTKAYKALTDEITMENFRLYGHPDGPQTTRMGIALPEFLVGSASPLILVTYVFLGIYGPLQLSRWWARQNATTRGGIQSATAAALFDFCVKQQPVFASPQRVLDAVLERGAPDYALVLPKQTLEQRKEAIQAYLNRQVVADEQAKLQTVQTTLELLRQFMVISWSFKIYPLTESLAMCQRCIVQAVPLELRHYGSYLELPGSQIEKLREDPTKATSLITKPMLLAARPLIPQLSLVEAKAFVPGLSVVPPGSRPFMRIRFVVHPRGATPVITKDDLEAMEVVERDQSAKNPRFAANPLLVNSQAPKAPTAFAPYLPFDWAPSWSAYIVNERSPQFTNQASALQHLDVSNLRLSAAELASGEKVVVGTWVVQFAVSLPNVTGCAYFGLRVLSDSYFSANISARVSVDMRPLEEVPEPEAAESDEEVDSEDELEGLSDLDTDTEDEAEKQT